MKCYMGKEESIFGINIWQLKSSNRYENMKYRTNMTKIQKEI